MKIKKVFTYSNVIVLMSALAFPISAGAFGHSPSESEVFQQPGKMASPANLAGAGGDVAAEKVPEPSSLMLLGVAIAAGVLVTMRKRVREAVKK